MSNLLPPAAKKQRQREYAIRVLVISMYSFSFLAIAASVLSIPTIILLQSQLRTIATDYDQSQQADVSFTEAEDVIEEANAFVTDVASMYEYEALIPYITAVLEMQTSAITLDSVTVERDESYTPATLIVSGKAATRTALPSFEAALESLPQVAAVEIPIENLAREVDVPFTVTVELANDTDV